MANNLESKNIHFVYKTTNLINGKYYVGMHSTNKLDDNYLGSGKYLWRSIKKYGKENFKKEILEFCLTREELVEKEKKLVNEDLLKEDLCMNLKPGGSGGFSSKEHQRKCAEAGKQRFLQKLKDEPEFAENFSKKSSQRNLERGTKGFKGKRFDWTGKTQSEENKQNILNAKKKKIL